MSTNPTSVQTAHLVAHPAPGGEPRRSTPRGVTNSRRFPHSVIVRAPGLLPMLYRPGELARALGISPFTVRSWTERGMPHERDASGHLWVDGRAFAAWVEANRTARAHHKLAADEGFCFGCNRPTPIVDPSLRTGGKWSRLSGTCPACGAKVNRGVRRDQP